MSYSRLDMLIRRHIATLRPQRLAAQGMMASKGVYITHEEVDALLDQEGADDAQPQALASDRLDTIIASKITASAKRGIFLSLPWVAQLFSLSPFEVQTLVVCLAPELRRKYDTLYAYLQDDITRKRPSVDLVLDVLCPSEAERWRARTGVLRPGSVVSPRHSPQGRRPRSPSGSSGLAQFLQLDQRMLHYILENDGLDGRLTGYATMLHPAETLEQVLVDPGLKTRLVNLCQRRFSQPPSGRQPFVFYFQGPYGIGKRDPSVCVRSGAALSCTSIWNSYSPASQMSRRRYDWYSVRDSCGMRRSISTTAMRYCKKTSRPKPG